MKYGYYLVAGLGLISCNTAYKANTLNTPLFTQKNELAVTVGSGNLQLGYSPGAHIGIMANGFYEESVVNNTQTGAGGRGYLGELGVGYFNSVPEHKVVYEVYGGAGMGHLYLNNNYMDDNNEIRSRTLNADGVKLFIQPAIGLKWKYVEVSGGLRYSNVNYNHVVVTNWSQDQLNQANLGGIGNTSYNFLEPALTLRGGLKYVKLQLQFLRSIKLNTGELNFPSQVTSISVFIKLPVEK